MTRSDVTLSGSRGKGYFDPGVYIEDSDCDFFVSGLVTTKTELDPHDDPQIITISGNPLRIHWNGKKILGNILDYVSILLHHSSKPN